jgi:hypothetical protein
MSTHVQHPHAARRERHVHRGARRRPRWGGSRGNELLTSVNAVVLLALIAVQGVTILALESLIHIHLFIGVVLLGPITLKLASTGYRFARYYAGAREYRAAGPPPTLLRAVAPVFVLATAGLFGSGVALLLRGHGGGLAGSLHVASFWIWLACLAIHVTFNAREVATLVRAQWLARARERIAGAELRATLVLSSLLGGVLLAIALLSKITGWHGD